MMLEILFKLVASHMVGDYLLQTDYIAKNKGSDPYILLVHCVLYTLSIVMFFSSSIGVFGYVVIFTTHVVLDKLKATGITPKKFGDKRALVIDQVMHYGTLFLILLTHI